MAVTALILFNQGGPGVAGRAFEGTLTGGSVTITNNNNANITSWTITLLDVPPGSSLTPGVLATASNNTPTASFTPDVPGSYRILLSVTDGSAVDKDIRNFGIRNARGIIIPSYQKLPDPLPVTGSNLSGEKPDEQNYGGQTRGWTGNGTDGNLGQFFLTYDDLPIHTVTSTPFTAAATGQEPLYYFNVVGAGVFNLPSGARIGQRVRVIASGTVTILTVNPPGGQNIEGLSSVQMLGGTTGVFVYLGSNKWTMLGVKRDKYEYTLAASTQDISDTGFQTIGATIIDTGDFPNLISAVWQAVIDTTNAADQAEVRIFNLTTSAIVAGSTLSTASLSPVLVSANITLASGANLYEAQLRCQTTGSPNKATCFQARILINWLQP